MNTGLTSTSNILIGISISCFTEKPYTERQYTNISKIKSDNFRGKETECNTIEFFPDAGRTAGKKHGGIFLQDPGTSGSEQPDCTA